MLTYAAIFPATEEVLATILLVGASQDRGNICFMTTSSSDAPCLGRAVGEVQPKSIWGILIWIENRI